MYQGAQVQATAVCKSFSGLVGYPVGPAPPSSNDMDLPSVPRSGLVSAPSDAASDASYAPSATPSGDDEPTVGVQQPRFARGQKVLYDSFEQAQPVRGTVAKIGRAGAAL